MCKGHPILRFLLANLGIGLAQHDMIVVSVLQVAQWPAPRNNARVSLHQVREEAIVRTFVV